MKSLGFETVETVKFDFDDDVSDRIASFITKVETITRSSLDYMIDGLVFKIDNLKERDSLGSTGKHPRWAVAYKFKSLDENTKVLDVVHQVGKTGAITPVAILEEVEIDNVLIDRASLHNYDYIKNRDIRILDTVTVIRANDVIPKVEKVLTALRSGQEKVVKTPDKCPSCGSGVEFEGKYLVCQGFDCEAQIMGKIQNFASKNALDIEGLGAKTVEILYNEGLVTKFEDIYTLKDKEKEFCSIDGFGKKSFENITRSVEETKNKSQDRILRALSIKNIGSISSEIIKNFKDIQSIIDSGKDGSLRDELLKIDGIGKVTAERMQTFFTDASKLEMLNQLSDNGLSFKLEEASEVELEENSNILEGYVFCITGKLKEYTNRKELTGHIKSLGGGVSSKVNSKTTHLINNDKESASNKNKDALKLAIPIITEADFINLI